MLKIKWNYSIKIFFFFFSLPKLYLILCKKRFNWMRKCKVICWFFCSQGFHTSWCWISCRFQWFGRWFCYWYCGRCWCKRAGTTTPSVCRYDFDSYLCWSTWSVRAYCCHLPVHKINAKQKLWNLSYILYTTIFLLELFFSCGQISVTSCYYSPFTISEWFRTLVITNKTLW